MEVRGQNQAPSTLPQEKNAATRSVRGWFDLEPVWTIWIREESFLLIGIRSPDRLFRILVTVGLPSKLFWPQTVDE